MIYTKQSVINWGTDLGPRKFLFLFKLANKKPKNPRFPASFWGLLTKSFVGGPQNLHILQQIKVNQKITCIINANLFKSFKIYVLERAQIFSFKSRFKFPSKWSKGLPRWHNGRESASQCKRCKRHRFNPWVRKIPKIGNVIPLQYSCLGKFHGQRILAVYSP